MPNPPLTTEERVIALDLRIRQQENNLLRITTDIINLASAVSNIAASVVSTPGVGNRPALKQVLIDVSKVLARVKGVVGTEHSDDCLCPDCTCTAAQPCTAAQDGD